MLPAAGSPVPVWHDGFCVNNDFLEPCHLTIAALFGLLYLYPSGLVIFQASSCKSWTCFHIKNSPKWVQRLFKVSEMEECSNEKAATYKGSGMDYLAIFSSLIREVLALVTAFFVRFLHFTLLEYYVLR